MNEVLNQKAEALYRIVAGLERVAVAFSAGVDSTLLLRVCVDVLGSDQVMAVVGNSDSLPREELNNSRELAALCGAELVELKTDEFSDPNYLSNPVNRCYFCKTALFDKMKPLADRRGFDTIATGTNADDLSDYRPGLKAAGERDVRAPLAEAGLTKDDVRALSRRLGLPTSEKPASPCLSSRIPYGEPVTSAKLRMIESGEAFLRSTFGIAVCRVRHHGDVARIEVPTDRMADLVDPIAASQIDDHFRSLGFQYVAVDLRGFRSGALNESLSPPIEVGLPIR